MSSQVTFYRSYGTNSIDEYANCVLELDDNGYLIAGMELVDDSIEVIRGNGVLLRTDEYGEEISRAPYMGEDNQNIEFRHAITTSDGKLAVAGLSGTYGFPYDSDLYLSLLDFEGELLWEAHVGGVDDQWGFQVREAPGGGFAVAGWRDMPSIGLNATAMYLVRFNALGDTLWTRTYADTAYGGSSNGYCLEVTADSGFVLAGERSGPLVIRTDANGDTLWRRQWDTLGYGNARDVVCTNAGDILITGFSAITGTARPYLAKLDPDGELLWAQTYPEVFPGWAMALCESSFGYVLGGMTMAYDFRIMAVDFDGELLWSHTILPTESYGYGYDVIQTSDGGFALCGLHGTTNAQMVLIKTDENGLITALSPEEQLGPSQPMQLFPNPAEQGVTATYRLSFAGRTSIRLLNAAGQFVSELAPSRDQSVGEHRVELDVSGFSAGCYFVEVANEREWWLARLIKQ